MLVIVLLVLNGCYLADRITDLEVHLLFQGISERESSVISVIESLNALGRHSNPPAPVSLTVGQMGDDLAYLQVAYLQSQSLC